MKTFGKWLAFCLMMAMMPIESIANDTVRMTWRAEGGSKDFSFSGTKDANFIVDWGDGKTETVTANGYSKNYGHNYDTIGLFHVMLYGKNAAARIHTWYCFKEKVKELNVKSCTALTSLTCSHNQLATIDVSKNTALTSLTCSINQLTSIDVRNNTALPRL